MTSICRMLTLLGTRKVLYHAYNKLPSSIKNLNHYTKVFKSELEDYLLYHSNSRRIYAVEIY
jgi:hypothetical protein